MALFFSKEEIPSSLPSNPAYPPTTAWETRMPGTPFPENDTGSAGVKSPTILAGTYGTCEIHLRGGGKPAVPFA